MKKIVKILCIILCICACATSLISCRPKTLAKYGDKKMSVNVYEFLLSRAKGTLAYYGYDVTNASFWQTVMSLEDGKTFNEYYCEEIKRQTIHYLIADKRFDDLGLKLPESDEKLIDDFLAGLVQSAGSKSNLNAELKEFGVNYDILREIYVIEAKIERLKEHLYGANGEKISAEEKEKYFNENYVGFKQIFVATYDYVIDTDRFGDTVYYTDEKHTAIAYDTVNGSTVTNEFGKVVKDVLGNPEYLTADGKVAYDKENGVVGYLLNEDGDKVIQNVSSEKKEEIYDTVRKYASKCNGDVDLFEEYMELYDESESSSTVYLVSDRGYYAAQNDYVAYLDDMAAKVAGLDVGECAVFESEYGYHVLCRYENESGAYDKKDNADMFAEFYDSLILYLFDSYCAQYEKDVKIKEKVFAKAPTMVDVGTNTLY